MAEMVDRMALQFQRGMEQTDQGLERSRNMTKNIDNIPNGAVEALLRSARKLCDSQPSVYETWQVDTTPFNQVSLVHRTNWDERSHGGRRGTFRAQFEDYMRYPHHMLNKRSHKANRQIRLKLRTIFKDRFGKETGRADWLMIKGTYPPEMAGKSARMPFDRILLNFRLGQNLSRTTHHHYYSREYCAQLFSNAGLGSVQDAMNLFDLIYMDYIRVWSPSKTELHQNYGTRLHTTYKGREALIMASIACQGSFQGERGWTLFHQTLIQGAWPWLGQYPKSYAKILYTAIICIFCIVRHGQAGSEVGPIILGLIAKLVDFNCFGIGPVRVRTTDSLTDPKQLYEPEGKKVEPTDGTPTPPLVPDWVISTTLLHPSVPGDTMPPYANIIPGNSCNHGVGLRYTGRFQLAASLVELATYTESGSSVVVSKTFGNAIGQREAVDFVGQRKILSVRRGEKQCVACAVRLAHTVGAIVVIA